MKLYYVYIMASKRYGTPYIGITNNIVRRAFEHKHSLVEGFTKRYNVSKLVYYEMTDDVSYAITREKRLKAWKRAWKLELIESANPEWRDLSEDFL